MIDFIKKEVQDKVLHRIWIFSDLQQSLPENARRCLQYAVEDFRQLDMSCQRIWYLGDAIEGSDLSHLLEMTWMQVDALKQLGIPVRYVQGNHDLDYFREHRKSGMDALPFYNNIRKQTQWQSIDAADSFCFIEDMGPFAVLFLSDHIDLAGRWFTSHGRVQGDTTGYPYGEQFIEALRKRLAEYRKPVVTVSHYAFAGGNRPAELQNCMLPLPENVKVHFYGHAHIGDRVWAGKDCYRKISCVDHQGIPQINVSSLENIRANGTRSVFLEYYADQTMGIYFRNHSTQQWEEYYLLNGDQV